MSNSCCCSTPQSSNLVPLADFKECAGKAAKVTSRLNRRDRLGMFKFRWGIRRMSYVVAPGLYQIGSPNEHSPVLVTANFKMTFDMVRSQLDGISAWILVLNTRGINVWCAAGKSTFGTDELVQQIEKTNLKSVVTHREIILPQLGAPGVAAHEVRKRAGFSVIYGPVYARDIRAFLAAGNRATPEMRRVRFHLRDRIGLIPMELIPALKWVPVLVALILIMRLADGSGFHDGLQRDLLAYLGTIGIGAAAVQVVLPWIPGRSFVLKGWLMGILWAVSVSLWLKPNPWIAVSNILVLPVIPAYLALNFTGSTTFTSLSGVQKEIRLATPVMLASAWIGIVLRIGLRLWS